MGQTTAELQTRPADAAYGGSGATPYARDSGQQAQRAGLGTTGKSFVHPQDEERATAIRMRRWKRQRKAQQLLPGESVSSCLRGKRDEYENGFTGVQVVRDQHGRVHYDGLITCGSVWHCPVCAQKIAEARAAEIRAAVAVHKARGGCVAMVTQTFPHTIELPLHDSIRRQADALAKFKQSRAYRRALDLADNKGSIRALEVTFGVNGWHPHTHTLFFAMCDSKILVQLLEELRDAWSSAVRRAGLGEINEHGYKVDEDVEAAYLAKWGHERTTERRWTEGDELAKAHLKTGKSKGGKSPFELLDACLAGDAKSGELFKEYAREFKGKRQLYWSPGLRDWLAVEEVSDEEIAQAKPEKIEIVARLREEDWSLVLSYNVRGEVLEIAKRHGGAGVDYFLDKLRSRGVGNDDPFYESGVAWWRKCGG
jgi:hypothetical protein